MHGPLVLIVEDDPEIRNIVTEVLSYGVVFSAFRLFRGGILRAPLSGHRPVPGEGRTALVDNARGAKRREA